MNCRRTIFVYELYKRLPKCTNSDVRLFADDCLVYRQTRSQRDAAKLQENLTALEGWKHRWQMSFHMEKCTVSWSRTKDSRCKQPIICTDTIWKFGRVESILMTNHIHTTISKAIRKLGFLRRSLVIAHHRQKKQHTVPWLDQRSSRLCPCGTPLNHTHQRFVYNNYCGTSPWCVTRLRYHLEYGSLQHRKTIHS